METLYKKVKAFILSDVNACLPDFEDKDVSLPVFTDKNVLFGAIDPFKNPGTVLCSIYPDNQSDGKGTISDAERTSRFTITVISRGAKYETILAQSCRYANSFLKAFEKNYDMSGEVANTDIGERKFYPDCGVAANQATAVEIELTIYENKEIEE